MFNSLQTLPMTKSTVSHRYLLYYKRKLHTLMEHDKRRLQVTHQVTHIVMAEQSVRLPYVVPFCHICRDGEMEA